MLSNQYLCKAVAYLLLVFGGYLAIYNTAISAYVIGVRSGLDIIGGVAIACGLTACELWFASWARTFTHWKDLSKMIRKAPVAATTKLCFLALGLGLVYHFDIESTRIALIGRTTDTYFFIWGITWLIVGPEVTITLAGWLIAQAKKVASKDMKENNSRDAERRFLRVERTTMIDLAESAGKESGLKKITARYGPQAEG